MRILRCLRPFRSICRQKARRLPFLSLMTFSEIFIIYLAIGAPFAVHSFFGGRMQTDVRNAGISMLKLTFWPVFASYSGFRFLANSYRTAETGNERRVAAFRKASDEIRADLENLLISANREMRKGVLRDFDRLSGVALAFAESEAAAPTATPRIFEAADHPMPDFAARCIFRRNRSRLAEHRNRACEALSASLESLRDERRTDIDIERIRLKIVSLVRDDGEPQNHEVNTDPVLQEKLQEA